MEYVEDAEYLRQQKKMDRKQGDKHEDAMLVQQISDYYQKPQSQTQFDYLYVTPGAPELGFAEWSRDSILSNYRQSTLRKIMWCVEEIRILEMMKLDAEAKQDLELIDNFIEPLIRFNTSEKFGLENGHRNIDGYACQLSRSTFSNIQQFRYNEDFERQQKGGGFFNKLSMPKFNHGWSDDDSGKFGWR